MVSKNAKRKSGPSCGFDTERGVNPVAQVCALFWVFHLGEQVLVSPDGDIQAVAFMLRTTTPC